MNKANLLGTMIAGAFQSLLARGYVGPQPWRQGTTPRKFRRGVRRWRLPDGYALARSTKRKAQRLARRVTRHG